MLEISRCLYKMKGELKLITATWSSEIKHSGLKFGCNVKINNYLSLREGVKPKVLVDHFLRTNVGKDMSTCQ